MAKDVRGKERAKELWDGKGDREQIFERNAAGQPRRDVTGTYRIPPLAPSRASVCTTRPLPRGEALGPTGNLIPKSFGRSASRLGVLGLRDGLGYVAQGRGLVGSGPRVLEGAGDGLVLLVLGRDALACSVGAEE